jgi:hypothetical protein
MKLLILSIALILLANTLNQTPTPTSTTTTTSPPQTPPTTTTANPQIACTKNVNHCACVGNPADANKDLCKNEYEKACYQLAECKIQSSNNNQCGWTQADWLTSCLSAANSLSGVLSAQRLILGSPLGKSDDAPRLGIAKPDEHKTTDLTKKK